MNSSTSPTTTTAGVAGTGGQQDTYGLLRVIGWPWPAGTCRTPPSSPPPTLTDGVGTNALLRRYLEALDPDEKNKKKVE